MIKIDIEAKGDQVSHRMEVLGTTMQEVAVALLRLKQIEKELIDRKFEGEDE